MISERLLGIVGYIDRDDSVVDVGCDHGYLSIYLKRYNLCKRVLATDVSINALDVARRNILLARSEIPTVLSDGVEDVDMSDYDTLVIAGMGSSTMLRILASDKVRQVKKLVLQSNNNYEALRSGVCKLGFYLVDNKIVYENGKFYEIMLFDRSGGVNTTLEIEYGIMNKCYQEYYKYLICKYEEIVKKMPRGYKEERDKILRKIDYLRLYCE